MGLVVIISSFLDCFYLKLFLILKNLRKNLNTHWILHPTMRQKLLLKKKSRGKQTIVVEQKSKTSQKLALHALQKQLQLIELKEWLMVLSFIFGAALLRVPMQAVPSAEPLTFFAILAGWLFGKKKGFLTGASSLYVSNFLVFGGQGPWTLFQAISFGIAGFLGGFLRKKSTIIEVLVIVLLATVAFEIIMNVFSSFFFAGNIFLAFFTAIPFITVHIVSNSIFAVFLPKMKNYIYEKGKFNEKDVCAALINRLNARPYFSWLKRSKTAEPADI